MSQQNVDAVRRAVDSLNRGDEGPSLEMADEALVFEPLRASVEGAYVGHDGLRAFWADTRENFDLFVVNHTDVRDLGDRVLTIGRIRVRGSGSGAETEVVTAAIWSFREGLLFHYKDYGDEAAAIAAGGFGA